MTSLFADNAIPGFVFLLLLGFAYAGTRIGRCPWCDAGRTYDTVLAAIGSDCILVAELGATGEQLFLPLCFSFSDLFEGVEGRSTHGPGRTRTYYDFTFQVEQAGSCNTASIGKIKQEITRDRDAQTDANMCNDELSQPLDLWRLSGEVVGDTFFVRPCGIREKIEASARPRAARVKVGCTRLRSISQSGFLGALGYSNGGVCYYMSNYIEKTIWANPGSVTAAAQAAKRFTSITIMMAFARAQNLRARGGEALGQQALAVAGALTNDRIYRMGIWIGGEQETPAGPNHELIFVTGSGREVVFFDPNFGFYQCQGGIDKEMVEQHVISLYKPGKVASFMYRDVRASNTKTPLSFQELL